MSDRVEKILSGEWATASQEGNAERLQRLRAAFEGHGLGFGPVLVRRLTRRQAERLEDLDSVEAPMILAAGASWALIEDAEALDTLRDRAACEGAIEEAQLFALGDVNRDLTPHQERFLERRVRECFVGLRRKLDAVRRPLIASLDLSEVSTEGLMKSLGSKGLGET